MLFLSLIQYLFSCLLRYWLGCRFLSAIVFVVLSKKQAWLKIYARNRLSLLRGKLVGTEIVCPGWFFAFVTFLQHFPFRLMVQGGLLYGTNIDNWLWLKLQVLDFQSSSMKRWFNNAGRQFQRCEKMIVRESVLRCVATIFFLQKWNRLISRKHHGSYQSNGAIVEKFLSTLFALRARWSGQCRRVRETLKLC